METAKIRDGAYGNFVTGMGRRDTDKTENTFVNPYAGTDIVELARIKVQDGIAARIVECVPETAFKEPVTITGDSSGKVFKEASAVGLFEALQLAGEYQRLTGGALIVSEYENEYDIEQLKRPAPENRKISQYRVYSAGKVEFQPTDFQGDTPKVYRVVLLDNKRIEIHPSRCTVIHCPRHSPGNTHKGKVLRYACAESMRTELEEPRERRRVHRQHGDGNGSDAFLA